MSTLSFPLPTTCPYCGTTQNGFCIKPACADMRATDTGKMTRNRLSVKEGRARSYLREYFNSGQEKTIYYLKTGTRKGTNGYSRAYVFLVVEVVGYDCKTQLRDITQQIAHLTSHRETTGGSGMWAGNGGYADQIIGYVSRLLFGDSAAIKAEEL